MSLTDSEIIAEFNSGRKDAFREIVARYEKKVFNTAYRMCGGYEDARDLAQEAFLKAYSKLHQFEGKSEFSTWLFTVTANVCRDFLRKKQRSAKILSLSSARFESGGAEIDIEDPNPAPQKALSEDMKDEIQAALGKLPADQKEVLVLREIQGLSYEKIAEITGSAEGTVKSRISRARIRLKDILKRRAPFYDRGGEKSGP